MFTNKIGKLKDFKVKLHINKDIRPYLEKPRTPDSYEGEIRGTNKKDGKKMILLKTPQAQHRGYRNFC